MQRREATVVFQGDALPIGALIERARAGAEGTPAAGVGLRHTAADNARACAALLATGESATECWRFGILQTLDDYTSALRRGGIPLASSVFADEPPATGSPEVDAAFAALADHLAARDGWDAAPWTRNPRRHTTAWYPSVPAIFRAEAERDSPPAFRKRGIYITSRSLDRA
jgi:hypothetical protein